MRQRRTILWTLLTLFLAGCNVNNPKEEVLNGLPGAWMLKHIVYPTDYERHFPEDGHTFCRIWNKDTTFLKCQVQSTASGIVIISGDNGSFELFNKGNNEYLYHENETPRPLRILNDSTITIQINGAIYTWIRNREMSEKRMDEIRNIVANATEEDNNTLTRYMLSTSERELMDTNHRLVFSVLILLAAILFILGYVCRIVKRKKHIEQQLQQITEEQSLRPQNVTLAFQQVENKFFESEYFINLHKRIMAGEVLKPKDWAEMEQVLKPVFPDFLRRLFTLCKMSETEWRVCLLIKLRFSPSEMANVLCKDISTISSIRSRLYKKVFSRSGGSKEWDEFILSL